MKLEFPDFPEFKEENKKELRNYENNLQIAREKSLDQINRAREILDTHKVFPALKDELKSAIFSLEKRLEENADLGAINTQLRKVERLIVDMDKENEKQRKLDELYKDDHLDQYRDYR